MGMFDNIIIEGLKLKTPAEVASFLKRSNAAFPTEFQTKDLDNCLGTYRINSKGDVFVDERQPTGKQIPYEPFYLKWQDTRPWLERMYHKYKFRNTTPDTTMVDECKVVTVKTKLTNTFCALCYEEIAGQYVSLNYEIQVVNGKVKKTKLLEWSIESKTDAADRHARDEQFALKLKSEHEKHKQFTAKWYYPVLKEVWNPVAFFGCKLMQATGNKLVKWSYHWPRV